MTIFTKFRLLFFSLLLSNFFSAQTWTWQNSSAATGTDQPTGYVVFGTKGVSSATTSPGARQGIQSWTDASGNFWLFGDFCRITGNYDYCNDLWKYDVGTKQWTWVSGSNQSSQNGSYGTKGVPSTTNIPGARSLANTWVDNSGNFWLFGGYYVLGSSGSTGYYINDLWKYNPGTNEWTWMTGQTNNNQQSFYGTLGVGSSSTTPCGRARSMCWTDNSGDLWLFGGTTAQTLYSGALNDLWKYSISNNQWIWMGGSSSFNQNGAYGTQGVSSNTNIPGARGGGLTWKDPSGNVYIYGGNGIAATGTTSAELGDLWKYNSSTNEWTWLNGANTLTPSAVYGTKGVSTSTNTPGYRMNAVEWMDNNANLWLYGGLGFSGDLWKYSPSLNEWVWMDGNNTTVGIMNRGTKGVASATNSPGYRKFSGAWSDNSGNFWLFGGETSYLFPLYSGDDVWKYEICSTAATPVNVTSVQNQTICSGLTTTVAVSADAPVTWFSSATSTTAVSSGTNFATSYLTAGSHTFFAEGNLCLPSTSRAAIVVSVNPSPTLSVPNGSVCAGSPFTMTPNGASTYSYSNGNSVISPLTNTMVTITGTSALGCVGSNIVVCSISVQPVPSLSVSGQFSLCNGSTSSLSVSGANTYTWGTTSVTSAIQVTPSTTTTYTVSGEFPTGCKSTAVKIVTVYPLPFISVTSGSICIGTTYTIPTSGAASYSFSGGSNTVSPLVNTSYTVTGFSQYGCASSNTVVATVSVEALPTFSINGNNYVCKGSSLSLLANGAMAACVWNNGSTSNLITVSPTLNAVYSVTVTGNNGCKSTATRSVSVLQLPTVTATADKSVVCVGDNVILSGQGAFTYTWTGGVIDGQAFALLQNSTFTVVGSDTSNCSGSSQITVSTIPLPTLTPIANKQTICAGESATLHCFGALSYTWTSVGQGSVVVDYPAVTTVYTVTGTGPNGCYAEATVIQQVDECTGVGNSEESGQVVTVYPNPASNTLVIDNLNENHQNILLRDALGKLILEIKHDNASSKLLVDVSELAPGIYYLSFYKNTNLISNTKLVKH